MDYGSIERELVIAASPEVLYTVISSPEHLREWWPDDADLSPDTRTEALTVIEADPPRRFAFLWVYDSGAAPAGNSLLVTFDLAPSGEGTLLRFTRADRLLHGVRGRSRDGARRGGRAGQLP